MADLDQADLKMTTNLLNIYLDIDKKMFDHTPSDTIA